MTGSAPAFSLRPARADELDLVVALKTATLRADLERLGVWGVERSRARVVRAFSPERTRLILLPSAAEPVGSISLREEPDGCWIELFYLDPAHQGAGLGSAVLRRVLDELAGRVVRLDVLSGSRARGLYERHGFVLDRVEGIDDFLVRHPQDAEGTGILTDPS